MRACSSRSPCSLLVLVIAGFAVHRPSSPRFVMGGCDGVADFVVSIPYVETRVTRVGRHSVLSHVCGAAPSMWTRGMRLCAQWAVRGCGRRVVGCGCLSSAPRAGAGLPRGRRPPANVSERSPRRPRAPVARRARSSLVVTSYIIINNSRRMYIRCPLAIRRAKSPLVLRWLKALITCAVDSLIRSRPPKALRCTL